MKAYGIWDTQAQRWATDSRGIIAVFYTQAAATAQLNSAASDLNVGSEALAAEVSEIGEDGRPVEIEG